MIKIIKNYLQTLLIVGTLLTSLHATDNLFTEKSLPQQVSPVIQKQATPNDPVARSRAVNINFTVLPQALSAKGSQSKNPIITLNLFTDTHFDVEIKEIKKSLATPTDTWSGNIVGMPHSHASIAITNGVVSGSVRTDSGKFFKITYDGNQTHLIQEIDESKIPQKCAPLTPQLPISSVQQMQNPTPVIPVDSGDTFDILVLYTPSAKNAAGGTAAIQSIINASVTTMNRTFANSNITPRVRLVHTTEVDYSRGENGIVDGFYTALNDLTGKTDGHIDAIHALRDQYGADMVQLFINNRTLGGLAWLMTNPSQFFESNAFSIVHYSFADGWAFDHEFGHNMGMAHDRSNSNSPGSYSYSYGFQSPSNSWHTVMGYPCSGWCPRIDYWSNPDVSYNGEDTGVPVGSSSEADARTTLHNNAQIIANWRQSTVVTPPNKPTNVQEHNVTSTTAILTWTDNSDDETGFNIHHNGQIVGNTTADTTTYALSNLTPATTYIFSVKAFNSAGESGATSVVFTTAQPTTVPTAPSNLQANNITTTSATLTWTDNSNDETSFKLYKEGQRVANIPANRTSYALSNLTPSTTYTYNLVAYNHAGESNATTTTFTTQTTATVPSTPTNLQANNITTTSAILTWSDNSNNEDGFNIYKDGLTNLIATVPANTTDYALSNLSPATTYTYSIRAFNSAGESNVTATLFTTLTPTTKPNAPTNAQANNVTTTSVTLTWSDNANNEDGFKIYDFSTSQVIATTANDVTSYTFTNLTPATMYRYRVVAFNSAGESNGTATTFMTLPVVTKPNTPTNLKANNITATSAILTWSDNSNNEDGFKIYKDGLTNLVATVPANTTSYALTNLSPATTYTYSIRAFNSAGESNVTATLFTTLTQSTVPNAPTNAQANNVTTTSVALTWTDNANNEDGFKIYDFSTSQVIATTANDVTSYTFTNLTPATMYRYRVVAFNSAGESNGTAATFMTLPVVTKPNTPTNLKANNITATSATLTWSDNSDNEDGFNIYKDGLSNLVATLPANTTSYSLTNLSPATLYIYSIRAFNSAGESNVTATPFTTLTQTTKPIVSDPNPANGVTVTAGASGQVLKIKAVGATSGRVYYDDDAYISFSKSATVNGDYLEVTIPYTRGRMKNNGTNYWYVKATNSAGTTRYPATGQMSFTVKTSGNTPVVSEPNPVNGATITEGTSGQVLRIKAVGATSGRVYYDDDAYISFSKAATVNGDYLEVTIPYTRGRMKNNGTNYWYVKATNSTGTTRYPATGQMSFTVTPSGNIPVVSEPNPTDGATVTEGASGQVLKIKAVGATSGRVYYDDDAYISFSKAATVNGDYLEVTIPYTRGRMKSNGTNYWYVKATNSAGTTRYPASGQMSFTVKASGNTPVISEPNPTNGTTVTAGASGQVLKIKAVGATSGRVYYDDDAYISFSKSATVNGDYLEVTIPYTRGRMKSNGTNYWYVKATNSAGSTRYPASGQMSFTVKASGNTSVVSEPNPANGATVTAGASGQVLKVKAVGATSGRVYYDDDPYISFSKAATVNGDYLEVTIPYRKYRMKNNGTNYWYIKATNNAGDTRYPSSGNMSFTVTP
jgi:titin